MQFWQKMAFSSTNQVKYDGNDDGDKESGSDVMKIRTFRRPYLRTFGSATNILDHGPYTKIIHDNSFGLLESWLLL